MYPLAGDQGIANESTYACAKVVFLSVEKDSMAIGGGIGMYEL